ncbi:MAG: class I SAM-dependent methyltransferase [Planctomycetota bacterium]
MTDSFEAFRDGEALRGDDFTDTEIEQWFADEEEGYANLGAKDKGKYHYVYHQLNTLSCFRFLDRQSTYPNVLGFGSAYGDEFLPIIDQIGELTIVDPSEHFVSNEVHGRKCRYVKPSVNGALPFPEQEFDLAVCFAALHHVPNVSTVVTEIARVLKPGGTLLVREPIVSMGDWSRPRSGLTKNERGIPLKIFRKIVQSAGFEIRHETLFGFRAVPVLARKLGLSTYNDKRMTKLDFMLSRAFRWNYRYHATSTFSKLRPVAAALVLHKREQ